MLTRRTGASTRIQDHAELLIDGRGVAAAPMHEHVDVEDLDALVALARALDCRITHVPDPWAGRDLFFLDDAGVRYRFRAEPAPSARRMASV